MKKAIYIILSFTMIIGASFAIIAAKSLLYSYTLDRQGITLPGRISNIKHVVNTETNVLVFYVDYTYNSNSYTIHNSIMDSDSTYKMNELVYVKLLPEAPDKAIIDSKKEKYTGYILPLAIGIFILLLCGGILIRVLNKG